MRKWISVATMLFVSGMAAAASAQNPKYVASPATFVGAAGDCGTGYPAGSKIVTSAWETGAGLPDNGVANPDGSKDAHGGLLLSKNGPTPNCSEAYATIEAVGTDAVLPATLEKIGFDYRNGTSCGAGAPRINVVDTSDVQHWFGCVHGQHSAAPQDPAQWTRVSFDGAGGPYPGDNGFVFGPGGTPVKAIYIEFDEGTDTAGVDTPAGPGLVVLDNIQINNTTITQKKGNVIKP